MKAHRIKTGILMLGVLAMLALPDLAEAQRMRGAAAGRGGARPTTTRSAPQRPAARPASRPSASRPASRPQTSQSHARPSNSSSRPTLNGGSNRIGQKPTNKDRVASVKDRNVGNHAGNRPGNNGGNRVGNNSGNRVGNNSGNRVGNNTNIGNRVNIDNSRNVNINVRNNRNVAYRPPYRPYPRPPVIWGGFGFSCFHPYFYHPFTPFYWGPAWHPWGFFVATLAATAIIVTVENQKYHYDEGVFYTESDGGYVVVEAPQGATVKVIPNDAETVQVNETVNNYYYGGTFYEKENGEYTVVAPTAGAVVNNLPEGAEEVKVGDETYVKYGDTYYLPVQVDGKNAYEIAQVEEVEQ